MQTSSSSSISTASHEEIARRARDIWVARGCPDGQDVEIWLLAERELAPPVVAPKAGKTSRKKSAAATAKNPANPDIIDVGDLQDRLSRFGEPAQRSPTSLDLS